jgi:hypothetical protein
MTPAGLGKDVLMNEEEYKRTLIRMWDNLREENRGDFNCEGVECTECTECPFNGYCNIYIGRYICNVFAIQKVVEEWGKAHPIETNREHFKKAFGYETHEECFSPIHSECPKDSRGKTINCAECKWYKDSEYHAPESNNAK